MVNPDLELVVKSLCESLCTFLHTVTLVFVLTPSTGLLEKLSVSE